MNTVQQHQAVNPSFRSQTASSPRISYLDLPADAARKNDLPLLLLHGVGSSSETWGELLPLLDGRRTIAPDYRGHGASEAPPPPYVMDDFVADIVRLLDELEVRQVHVAGFSIGALFAERLALLHSSRVRSLLLLSSIAARTTEQRERASARLAVIASTEPREVAPQSAARWFTAEFIGRRPDLVQREVDIVSRVSHAPYAASYKVLVENDPIDAVAAITQPTLIMTGEMDEGSTPAMSQALHDRISGSRLVIVPGVKHYLHIERPEAISPELNDFLAAADAMARPLQLPG